MNETVQLALRAGFIQENHHFNTKALTAFAFIFQYWPHQTMSAEGRSEVIKITSLDIVGK